MANVLPNRSIFMGMDEQQFLRKVFTTNRYTSDELDTIIPKFKRVTFSKADFLLNEGKVAKSYWFVQRGFIRSYVIDVEGKDISTNFYTAGNIAMEWSSFMLRKPTRENMQAITDCICWELDYESFQTLFHGIETFREQGRANLAGEYFALKNRGISMIADSAKDRYKRLLADKPEIVQNVSLKQIATYLGITDTSLSRIRKEIAKE